MYHSPTGTTHASPHESAPQHATPEYLRLLSAARIGTSGALDQLVAHAQGGLALAEAPAGVELVVFLCGSAPCAAPLGSLREVLPALPPCAPLPASPPWMLGVFSLRAEMLGLVDPSPVLLGIPTTDLYIPVLAKRGSRTASPLRAPSTSPLELAMVVVAGEGERSLGLAVGAVGDLAHATADELLTDPATYSHAASPIAERYIAGIYSPRGTSDHYALLAIEQLIDDLIALLDHEAAHHG